MKAQKLDITVRQGTDEYATFGLDQDDGTPLDLTGAYVKLQARASASATRPVLTLDSGAAFGGASIQGQAGDVNLHFTPAHTLTLKTLTYKEAKTRPIWADALDV